MTDRKSRNYIKLYYNKLSECMCSSNAVSKALLIVMAFVLLIQAYYVYTTHNPKAVVYRAGWVIPFFYGGLVQAALTAIFMYRCR